MWIHRQIALILAATLASPALAADNSLWTNLSALKPGTRIGIIQSDMKRLEGHFEGFTESGISVRTDREVTLRKEDVVRVYRRPLAGRTIRAAVGAAIGAAGGAIWAVLREPDFATRGRMYRRRLHGGGVGIGAAIGALGGSGYRTVYQR
jgi:hypothetical protein